MAREQDYITEARAASKAVWDGINKLVALQREWNALDYGNNPWDGEGANAGVSSAQVGAVVFATADAFLAVLAAGSATNMAALL